MLASFRLIESKVWFPKLIYYKGHYSIAPPKAGHNLLGSLDHTKGRIVELDFYVGPLVVD